MILSFLVCVTSGFSPGTTGRRPGIPAAAHVWCYDFVYQSSQESLLEKVGLSQNVEYDLTKTLFVVTVPAIWSDEAKKFMWDAAVNVTWSIIIILIIYYYDGVSC